jgi:hypothetical protein
VGLSASRVLAFLAIAASHAWGQSITLQIKPHVGDTLRMRLDQQSEMTGVKRSNTGEASAIVVTSMKMFSRAIVESGTDKTTTVLAVTDSVLLATSDERSRSAAAQAETQLRGQRVRFRVAPDGSVGMNETADGASRDVAQVVSLMPAAFPKAAISVGESWIREMALPASQQFGSQLSGKLYVTFRFDSLTHGGEWAFISMRGELHPSASQGVTPGPTLEKGEVSGTMLVDQKRRWLTESWFSIVMSSVVTPPLTTGVVSMHMLTRITQHMHTFAR